MTAEVTHMTPFDFHSVAATCVAFQYIEDKQRPEWVPDFSTLKMYASYSEPWMKPEHPPLTRPKNRQDRRKAARGKR